MYDLLINVLTHPAIGVVTFLAGALLGNFFAIGRDGRKVINDAATKFRSIIAKEISERQGGKRVDLFGDTSHRDFLYAGILEFKCVLPPIHQKTLWDLWQEYEKQNIFNAIRELNKILSFTENLHKYSLFRNIRFIWGKFTYTPTPLSKEQKDRIEELVSFHNDRISSKEKIDNKK